MTDALEGALAGALEEALIGVYERDREMFDADAIAAIDALMLSGLVALWQPGDETADPEALSYWAYAAYEAMRTVCEAYTGRDIPSDIVDEVALSSYTVADDAPRDVLSGESVTAVLLQLRQSIEYWQERGGFRGFYESIRE